jgi:hypothetical protein
VCVECISAIRDVSSHRHPTGRPAAWGTDPLLTRIARSACALTACEPVVELTWGKLTLACSPSRGTDGLCSFGRSAGLPGRRASRPRLSRARGPAHEAGPQDHLPIGEGSVVRPAHRAGVVEGDRKRLGTVIRVVMSCLGLVKSMARGVVMTRRILEDSERSDQSIQMGRPGPRSLHWSQAGTAGLREYLPHNQGKARRGNRDSEGPSKQRPWPGSCDRKSLG